jgi:hypothetical protein
MSTIQATCPSCRSSVRLEPDALLVLTVGGAATTGTYLFFCDVCEQVAAKPARASEIILLAAVGVRDNALRPTGPPTAHGGGHARPFTPDDVIDFHRLLAGEGWLARLLAGAYGSCA